MKILVTGSTGFIGSYFIPMLLHQGHTVKLLVRNEEKARKLFGNTCDYHIGDITDRSSLKGCCDGIDIVFHLVAKSGNDLPTKEMWKEQKILLQSVLTSKNLFMLVQRLLWD